MSAWLIQRRAGPEYADECMAEFFAEPSMEPIGEDTGNALGSADRQADAGAGNHAGAADRCRPAAVYLSRVPEHAVCAVAEPGWCPAQRLSTRVDLEYRQRAQARDKVMDRPLLQVRIQAGYGRQPVLRDISFDVHAGEILGLVGTSGAGKSTLVLSLLGLLQWRGGKVTGEILFVGQDLLRMRERDLRRLRGKTIALVPQSPMTALNSALSLRAHFEEAWKAHESS